MIYESNISGYEKLDLSFYIKEDVVQVAKELLGKVLFTMIDGRVTGGIIVETEAYCGRTDKACHAYGKRTARTEVMYGQGGVAYIYLCYGIHHLFNVVTHHEGMADAVLVRAIQPLMGVETMRERRNQAKRLASGPGTLSQALGIYSFQTGTSLLSDKIWIASPEKTDSFEIQSDVRIGVDYADEDALLPWRFVIKGNPYVSKKVR